VYLPHKIYRVLEKNSSLLCIDLFIVDSVKQPKKLLAIKRAQEPGKGLWFQPGGRIYKNESISQAAIRKAKEELGVDVTLGPFIGTYRNFFMPGHRQNPSGTDALKYKTYSFNFKFYRYKRINNLK